MKNKIVFLILNYETYWETDKCIKSIYRTIGKDNISSKANEIVIVDNGSKNDSLSKLNESYKGIDGIHILETGKNLGFAKGNNLGFRYAKDKLFPNFIVMINSDIIMIDESFEEKLLNEFNKYQFAVAGPNIKQKSGTPLYRYSRCLNQNDIRKSIKKSELQIKLCKLRIELFYVIWCRIMTKLKMNRHNMHREAVLKLEEGEQLHGCFLIFSKIYIDLFDGIYDKTFLYGEEILLRLRCKKMELKMCYLENIEVIHNESRTDKFVNKDIFERHLQRHRNNLNALKVILEYMDSGAL